MAQQDPFSSPELGRFVGGAIPSPPDDRDYPFAAAPHMRGAIQTNHDLRQYRGQSLAMPIGDQQQVGSCTAWAWGYQLRGALSAKYHIDTGTPPDLGDTLAAGWLYDMERSPEFLDTYPRDSGADMRTGGAVLVKYGIPPTRYAPYTGRADNGPLEQVLTPERAEAAAYYGVSDYFRCSGTGQQLINSILQSFHDGYPVVIALLVGSTFENVGPNGRVGLPRAGEQVLGAHAVTLFGNYYDNSAPGGIWLVGANQWGTDWGEDGWFYLPAAWAWTSSGQYGAWLQEAWTAR